MTRHPEDQQSIHTAQVNGCMLGKQTSCIIVYNTAESFYSVFMEGHM